MRAASGGHAKYVDFLMKEGASVKDIDNYGDNMLMFASIECKVEAMEYFVKQEMDINACNKKKETALMKVIDQPYEYYFPSYTCTKDQNDSHSECVKLLVVAGADVNKRNVGIQHYIKQPNKINLST